MALNADDECGDVHLAELEGDRLVAGERRDAAERLDVEQLLDHDALASDSHGKDEHAERKRE